MSDLRHSSVILKCMSCHRESRNFIPAVLNSLYQNVRLCPSCLQPVYLKKHVDAIPFKHPDVLRIFEEVSL